MTTQVELSSVFRETLRGAVQLLATVWPWLLIYSLVKALSGVLSGVDIAGLSSFMFIVVLGASCLWTTVMYRELLPVSPTARFKSSAASLLIATLLVYMLYALVVFIIGLFLVITSAILIAASGYDPSNGDAESVAASIEALRASGGIWMIYLFSAAGLGVLVWFGLRLFLFGVATVVGGKTIVFQSWPLTKGHALKIGLLSAVLIGVPLLIAFVASEATAGGLGLPVHWTFAEGFIAEQVKAISDGRWPRALNGFLSGLYQAPAILLGHSLAATIYRRLGPLDVVAD